MSRARHEKHDMMHKRAKGGGVGEVGKDESMKGMESYTAGDPDTEKEADRRARGGGIKMKKGKMPHMVHGSAPRHHGNRPGRKGGGSVGADSHPMTQAAHLTPAEGMGGKYAVDKRDD